MTQREVLYTALNYEQGRGMVFLGGEEEREKEFHDILSLMLICSDVSKNEYITTIAKKYNSVF